MGVDYLTAAQSLCYLGHKLVLLIGFSQPRNIQVRPIWQIGVTGGKEDRKVRSQLASSVRKLHTGHSGHRIVGNEEVNRMSFLEDFEGSCSRVGFNDRVPQ